MDAVRCVLRLCIIAGDVDGRRSPCEQRPVLSWLELVCRAEREQDLLLHGCVQNSPLSMRFEFQKEKPIVCKDRLGTDKNMKIQ